MANRVTGAEVIAIMDTTLTAVTIDPFITVANLVVTEKLTDAGHSAALLKEIERWLAAHFATVKDPRIMNEKAGDMSAKYEVATLGKALDGTVYGQTVKVLDSSGILANVGKMAAKWETIDSPSYDPETSS